MHKRFTIIDHTADIGILCTAETVDQLFESAAEGLFSIVTDVELVSPSERRTIEVQAASYDDLLIQWLQELIYEFSTRHYLYSDFSAKISQTKSGDLRIVATCAGEPVNFEKHRIHTEIKTATYHQLYVRKLKTGWEGRVIFDL